MKATIGNRNVSKQIAKALEVAAARRRDQPLGAAGARGPDLRVWTPTGGWRSRSATTSRSWRSTGDDVRLTWRAPDGRETATVPAAIADQKAAVTRAKEQVKELRKAVGLERGRIEDLFAEDREWASPTGGRDTSSIRSRARSGAG